MTQLGCSRTPLRTALITLQHENLVHILPNRGFVVADISVFDLQQNFEARMHLEAAAVRLAAQRASEKELRALERSIEHLASLAADARPAEVSGADSSFHQLIVEASKNQYLVDAYACVRGPAQRLAVMVYSHANHTPQTVVEHREIVEALKLRDSDAAVREICEHIQNGKTRILGVL